jgi:hypothetical protein
MQLLDVGRQPAELSGQGRQQDVADGRLGGDQLAELLARQDDRLRREQRGRRRGTRRAVQERQLTEHVARRERGQDRLVTLLGRQGDLHVPGHDDVQRVPGVTGVEDDLAPAEPPGPGARCDPFESGLVQPGEERDPGQGFDQRAGGQHLPIVPPATNPSFAVIGTTPRASVLRPRAVRAGHRMSR